MNLQILYICDGTLLNPIVQTQVLPMLNFIVVNSEIKCRCISFEDEEELSKDRLTGVKDRFSNKIEYKSITFKSKNWIPNWFYLFKRGITDIFSMVKNNQKTVIHARSLFPAIIAFIVIKVLKRNAKYIYDNRGVFIDEEIFKGRWKENSFKVKLFRYLEKLTINGSDAIVLVSDKFKEHILSNSVGAELKNKINVIPNGTEVTEKSVKPGNDDSTIIGVYSGSIAKWQNQRQVLELIIYCNRYYPRIHFLILTYQKGLFQQLLDNYNFEFSNVEINSLESDQVKNELKKCHFGIMIREQNIINYVASPLKFSEYLAAGLPILLSSGIGDTESLVERNNVGVILNNDNYREAIEGIMKLVSDKGIADRCMNTVKNHLDITTSFKEYKQIYSRLFVE